MVVGYSSFETEIYLLCADGKNDQKRTILKGLSPHLSNRKRTSSEISFSIWTKVAFSIVFNLTSVQNVKDHFENTV